MFTKKELKKKILNYAYEQCCANRKNTSSIGRFHVQDLPSALDVQKSNEEYILYAALHELLIQNLIMKYQKKYIYMTLTPKGKEIAEKQLDIDEYSLRLENFVDNIEILNKCQDLFNNGEYETAIFSAYKLLEVRVREKAQLEANDLGVTIMDKAFKVSEGKLYIPTCETPSEETGIHNLFRGAISTFKNPTSHRFVDYKDPKVALQILLLSELLLNLLKTAQTRDNK